MLLLFCLVSCVIRSHPASQIRLLQVLRSRLFIANYKYQESDRLDGMPIISSLRYAHHIFSSLYAHHILPLFSNSSSTYRNILSTPPRTSICFSIKRCPQREQRGWEDFVKQKKSPREENASVVFSKKQQPARLVRSSLPRRREQERCAFILVCLRYRCLRKYSCEVFRHVV